MKGNHGPIKVLGFGAAPYHGRTVLVQHECNSPILVERNLEHVILSRGTRGVPERARDDEAWQNFHLGIEEFRSLPASPQTSE